MMQFATLHSFKVSLKNSFRNQANVKVRSVLTFLSRATFMLGSAKAFEQIGHEKFAKRKFMRRQHSVYEFTQSIRARKRSGCE